MKKIILTALSITLATIGFSQENVFPANGNVGIGTISPQANLDIYRSYSLSNNKSLKMFYLGSWGYVPYANNFRFLDIESTEGGKILQLNGYGMGIGFDPPVYSSPDKLYVNGNVGIGTNNPTQKLTVLMDPSTNGAGVGVQAVTDTGPGSQPGVAYLNSSGSKRMYSFLDINTDTYNIGNVSGTSLLTINQSGNVGIGTMSPVGTLHVKGSTFIGNRDLTIGTSGSFVQIDQGASEGNTYTQIRAFSNGGNSANNLVLQNSGGNVGIGINNPDERLAVNGKIRAREIKVEIANWPDYVFSKTYPLPTLQEIESHIKEKGHLPGIPSAKEVKAKGIDLGEMNAKLLQKIEELTLHLIKQEQTNNLQNKLLIQVNEQLKKQQKEINMLKTKP